MLSPLEPRSFFADPWVGDGELRLVGGLVRRFEFESRTTWLSDDAWLVRDTSTWPRGRVEVREGVARLVAPDRVRMSYDGMPGGTELTLRADGFSFSPYRLFVGAGPLGVLLRARDECVWGAGAGELRDRIELSWLGIPVAVVSMVLNR